MTLIDDTTSPEPTAEAPTLVRARTVRDVHGAIGAAVRSGVPLTVRGGGHSVARHSTATTGVALDLGGLGGVTLLDPARRIVRAGGGATWGRVAATLAPHGLAISAGDSASVGVGGLTLGGGIGWAVRRFGLALDQLVGAEVMVADGGVHRVSAEHEPDLFWALRGGGGNLGVVLSFDFVASPLAHVGFGTTTYADVDRGALVAAWREHVRSSNDRLTSTLTFLPTTPAGPASALVRWCLTDGDQAAVAGVAGALRGLGRVQREEADVVPYDAVLEEAAMPPGMRVAMRSAFVPELTDAAIADLVALGAPGRPPTVLSLRALGGAMARVPAEATAFAHRDAEVLLMAARMAPPGAPSPAIDGEEWSPVARVATGAYVGFSSDDDDATVGAIYPPAVRRRLAEVKRAYDPGNVFRRNHNVTPA